MHLNPSYRCEQSPSTPLSLTHPSSVPRKHEDRGSHGHGHSYGHGGPVRQNQRRDSNECYIDLVMKKITSKSHLFRHPPPLLIVAS